MSTKTVEPWYVPRNRSLKAARIADCLRMLGVTAADAVDFVPKDRRMAEKAAGVTNPGSQQTWQIIIEMLAGSAQEEALCPFCGHGDPLGDVGPALPYGHQEPCRREVTPRP